MISDSLFETLKQYALNIDLTEKEETTYDVNEDWAHQFFLYFGQYIKLNRPQEDDMIYYVSNNKKSGKNIHAFRYDSPEVPATGSEHFDWRETVILNMLLHEFKYYLLVLISDRNNKNNQLTATLELFPTTVAQNMKNKKELISTYPLITFNINSYEETFNNFNISENFQMSIEVIVKHKEEKLPICSVFGGKLLYDKFYQSYMNHLRNSGFSLKKFLGFKTNHQEENVSYLKFFGPHGIGFCEIAIDKPSMSTDNQDSPDIFRTRLTQINLEYYILFKKIFCDSTPPFFKTLIEQQLLDKA